MGEFSRTERREARVRQRAERREQRINARNERRGRVSSSYNGELSEKDLALREINKLCWLLNRR